LPAAVSFGGTLLLATAFVLSRYCRRLTLHIERRWHALSAGVIVAYVFVNVMPHALCTVLSESREYTQLQAQYRNGTLITG